MTVAHTHNGIEAEVARALAEATRREAQRRHHRGESARHSATSFFVLDWFELSADALGDGKRTRVIVIERTPGRLSTAELERQFNLTRREAEVAHALSERLSSAEIAR